MISMPKVQSIRRRRMNGESIASIARSENVSEPTVRKCILSTRRVPSYRGEVDRVTGRYVAGLSWLGLSGRWFLGYCMRAWVLR